MLSHLSSPIKLIFKTAFWQRKNVRRGNFPIYDKAYRRTCTGTLLRDSLEPEVPDVWGAEGKRLKAVSGTCRADVAEATV